MIDETIIEITHSDLENFVAALAYDLAKKERDDHNEIREHYGQSGRVAMVDSESMDDFKKIILEQWEKYCAKGDTHEK
jgi:hypothetical protein